MEVPILKQGPYLIASIQSAVADKDLVQLRDALVEKVGKFRSRGVIVDVTVLDAAFAELGAPMRLLDAVPDPIEQTMDEFISEMGRGVHSWTWRIDPVVRGRATDATRTWAKQTCP